MLQLCGSLAYAPKLCCCVVATTVADTPCDSCFDVLLSLRMTRRSSPLASHAGLKSSADYVSAVVGVELFSLLHPEQQQMIWASRRYSSVAREGKEICRDYALLISDCRLRREGDLFTCGDVRVGCNTTAKADNRA